MKIAISNLTTHVRSVVQIRRHPTRTMAMPIANKDLDLEKLFQTIPKSSENEAVIDAMSILQPSELTSSEETLDNIIRMYYILNRPIVLV